MQNSFPGDHSGLEPPDSISNSEVKRARANDSVRSPHVKVGHRQGFILEKRLYGRFFFLKKALIFAPLIFRFSTDLYAKSDMYIFSLNAQEKISISASILKILPNQDANYCLQFGAKGVIEPLTHLSIILDLNQVPLINKLSVSCVWFECCREISLF